MRANFVGILPLVFLSALAMNVAAQDQDETAAETDEAVETPTDARSAERESLEPRVTSAELSRTSRRVSNNSGVMDEIDLERTEITGNQELPKVLYIVPWQKSDPGDLMGRPVNTLLDEVLAPVDRGEFVRQIRYYGELQEEQPDAARE